MLRPLLLLALLVSFAPAHALNLNESIICSPQTINIHAIVCCDVLPENACKATIEKLVTPEQTDFVAQLTADILAYPKERKTVANSFRAALELTGTHLPDPEIPLALQDFEFALNSYYKEIYSTQNMQVGDLLVFDEQGQYLVSNDGESAHWQKDHEIIHAMVYVGSGMVLQKETIETAVSSLSSLERAFVRYNASAQSTIINAAYKDKKTSLAVRIFRKIY